MNVTALLDRPTYLYAEVDRLVGLAPGTARRWINGYERVGKYYEPILRTVSRDTEWATWGEFVETRMLSEFRDQSVATGRLRAAVEVLRERFNVDYPLAHLGPFLAVDSGELTISEDNVGEWDESVTSVVRTGQLLLRDSRGVFETATLVNDELGNKVAAELPLDPEFPGIKVNPDRLGGQPTFEGRRVSVRTIAGMVDDGDHPADVAADFGLSLAQVDAAGRYTRKHKLAA